MTFPEPVTHTAALVAELTQDDSRHLLCHKLAASWNERTRLEARNAALREALQRIANSQLVGEPQRRIALEALSQDTAQCHSQEPK